MSFVSDTSLRTNAELRRRIAELEHASIGSDSVIATLVSALKALEHENFKLLASTPSVIDTTVAFNVVKRDNKRLQSELAALAAENHTLKETLKAKWAAAK